MNNPEIARTTSDHHARSVKVRRLTRIRPEGNQLTTASSSVDESLRRVATEERRGPFARLRLSIPKALTPLRRTKTDGQRADSPASDTASTRAIFDGISSFSPRSKKVSKSLCELSPSLLQYMPPANDVSPTQSSSTGTMSSVSESNWTPSSEDTSAGSHTYQGTSSMAMPIMLPDIVPENETFLGNVTFRDDGTKAKTWADRCAEQTQLKSYDATAAAAAAAELLEHRTGPSILTPGPVEAVDRFPLTPRERSDPFQTGMESPPIDKVFQFSSASVNTFTAKSDKDPTGANEKAESTRLMTQRASDLEKPGKAKKTRRNSSYHDITAQRSDYDKWRDLRWEEQVCVLSKKTHPR